ncbi:MAG: hypothetical protein Kow006_20990 [Gammaproteobacteria bacterium]
MNPAPVEGEPLPGRLVKTFQRVRDERMADLPICNPHLDVEAVGFRRWEGQWVGVLITPWTIGLYILPDDESRWPRVPTGGRCNWRLPAGEYQFLVDQEAELGPFHVCTLMSPVQQFTDQATARASAEAVLEKLFGDDDGSGEGVPRARQARVQQLTDPQVEEPLTARGVTRRDFLRKFRNH